jgi:type 1 fimbria pilin
MRKTCIVIFLIIAIITAPSCIFAADSLNDGTYTIEVTLSGGSGRATVESPCELTISGGEMTAIIIWSSSNYDLMTVDDINYYPINEEGNSTFEIPVANLDEDLSISAETVAMSEPHMIDYTLNFDSSTLSATDHINLFLVLALGAVAVGVTIVLTVLLKRKNKAKNAK